MKIKGIYLLYRTLQAISLPLLILYFLWRWLREPGYRTSFAERFGFLPRSFKQTGPGAIWLHAVSVGEILSCVEFLKALRREFPRTRIFVSTSTVAGRKAATEKLHAWTNGAFYCPVDYVWAVRRVLRMMQPSVVLIAETEIWPNLFREVKRTGAALALVNGRISDRALPRYRAFPWFFRAVLPALDRTQAQSETMRERFLELGAPPERVEAAGNFKYDFDAQPSRQDSPAVALVERLRPAKVWIAASIMPPVSTDDIDEEDTVIDALHRIAADKSNLLLILVPRKPERFDPVARKLERAGISHVRRSQLGHSTRLTLPGVLLLDSIGELSGLFALADVVFMGGTLARRGGHNILEPALFAKPVIIGPHMENFQATADEFRQAGAAIGIGSASELVNAVKNLLESPEEARQIGRRALACAKAKRGASAAALALVHELYVEHLPRYRVALPWRLLLWVLSRLWIRGARARARAVPRWLGVPVIGVGNITMGGTGKTPCGLRLAAELKQRGRRPGILTRGYARLSPEKQLIVAPGAIGEAERTGDEAQLFIRSGLAPVGIGADRFETGAALARRFGAGVLLLDDGFQHRRLARAVDILLVDALNPFGGGEVFPLGRLREPPEGLARADVILITRNDFTDLGPAIERQVRKWNPSAPVFRAHIHPEAWIENRIGTRFAVAEPPFERPAVFCGLGNPESFRRTLEQAGARIADWHGFADHHRYRPRELQYLYSQAVARGADALVTTEKDAMNLCEGADDLVAPLRIFRLEVTLMIEDESEFVEEIEKRVASSCRSMMEK